ncbi:MULTISPECIES: DUF4136 domain-containing protein [Elizabethkingia]|uniref:DUF4136 domain-containing protein n=1 Tax=Elizabethkingia ursingii TaxID=1756150 RepID=A0AAJ3NEP9_9FLAO|nr:MULTISPECIES: DUF4136 domain-containing protein [Elizabethkingia]AQW92905.1 hypothetical protein BBD30_01200 [Elizabethkingia anophelis]AQX09805.1 hypothetical protein BBD34_14670 [Elizabethkingia ursingii]OPB60824.1 hypothetical protein BAS07_17585 [Elizabethkingia anophelis]OPB78942.1 hypothetical protein BAY32_18985 [Elizabethkingia ursingii]OPB91626.1 hypothetical protein BB021_17075 [Elizabethkingia ursingii]
MKNYITLLFVAALASCSSFNIKSDYDRDITFSKYQTYEVRPEVSGLNDLDKNRIVSAIKEQLSAKGMRESTSPDLVISLKETTQKISNVETISQGGWGWRSGGFGSATVTSYDQGTLVLNFIDTQTKQLVWQGTGTGINMDNSTSKVKQIPVMVGKMLDKYPPGQGNK